MLDRLGGLKTRPHVVFLLLAIAAPAHAVQVLLDDQDCTDWARTFDSIVWKQKGSALGHRSLLKFDLGDLGPVETVNQATLHLFIERGQQGVTLDVHHVHDDGWSYIFSESDDLYNWPTAELIASVDAGTSKTVTLDVTAQIAEDVNGADGIFSIKLGTLPFHAGVRVASPLASRWTIAPRLHVDYESASAAPDFPNLTLSTGDIAFQPMRPAPGDSVTVSARIRNTHTAPSTPTTVEFWDGPPAAVGASLIGVAQLPALAAGGGAAVVETSWESVPRGFHEVHVVIDPGNPVQAGLFNRIDFRSFLVADEYDHFFDSFEYAGRNEYYTDFEVPPQFGLSVPKPAFLERSAAASCHGDYHLEAILDGTADDGTVWIERAVPVEPWSQYRVQLDWREFRYEPDMAFPAVAAIDVLDPEMEADFTFLGFPPDDGCWPWSFEKVVDTGPYDHVWVAMGFSIIWESPGTVGLDSVSVELEKIGTSGAGSASSSAPMRLSAPIPNPSRSGAEVRLSLRERSRLDVGIYDAQGRLVRQLFDGYDGPGERTFHWDMRISSGERAAPGVYFFSLSSNGRISSRHKAVVIR